MYGGNTLPTFQDNLSVLSPGGLRGSPETSVRNYHHTLLNIPEECRYPRHISINYNKHNTIIILYPLQNPNLQPVPRLRLVLHLCFSQVHSWYVQQQFFFTIMELEECSRSCDIWHLRDQKIPRYCNFLDLKHFISFEA